MPATGAARPRTRDDRGPDQLEGAYAAVTGDPEVGFEVSERLGMRPFLLADGAKPLYHAASAFASNYLVTLTAVAVSLMERAGIERELACQRCARCSGGRSRRPAAADRPDRPR